MKVVIVLACISLLAILVCLGAMIRIITDKKIGTASDGSSLPAADIKMAKRIKLILPTFFLVIFCVVLVFNGPKAIGMIQGNKDATDGTVNETPAGENQPEDQAPANVTGAEGENPEATAPTAENASEDAGDTDNGNTEADIQSTTQELRESVKANTILGVQKFGELLADTLNKTATEEQPEGTAMTAEDIRQRVTNDSTAAWTALDELTMKRLVTDTVVKIDPDEVSRLFGQYCLDIPLHLDWEEANWLKERIAESGRGHADDLIGFPMYGGIESWIWFDQAIGCREVVAEDLKGIDLTDHEAVWKIVEPKLEAWQKEFNELSVEEQNSRIDELVLYAINNMSSFSEMAMLTFTDMEWFYYSAKSILDDVALRYDRAYDITGKNKRVDPVGRECFMTYPEDLEEFFNPDRPDYNAVYTEDFFYDISGQMSLLYMRFTAQSTGTYTTDRHWCYPKSTTTALRRVAPASYTEKNGKFLRKLSDGKYGATVDNLLVNLDDGRFAIQTQSRTTTTTQQKPVVYNLDIDYVYADGSPTHIPHYHAELKFGDAYRIVSPTIDGYTCDTPIVEGTMPARNMYYKVIYRKPGTTDDNNNGNPGSDPGGDPGEDPEDPDDPQDGEGAKVTAASSDNQTVNDQGTGGEHYENDGTPSGDGNIQTEKPNLTNSSTSTSSSSTSTSTSSSTSTSTSTSSTSTSTSSTSTSTGTSTTHEASTSSNPSSSSTATSFTGSETSTTNNPDGTSTSVTSTANAAAENNGVNLSAPQ